MIEPSQIWLDRDRKYRPPRQVRIERIERRGLFRVAKISARQGDEPWHPVIRFIRLDRLPKRFTLQGS